MKALLLLALPLAAQAQMPVPAPADAVEFVRTCYTAHYENQGFGDDDLVKRKDWFTPRLYALLKADAQREPESADPPRLAFDPFTNAQEDADHFEIGGTRWDGQRAYVEVLNFYGTTALRVTLQLVKLEERWRIENMLYGEGFTLRRILATPP